MKERIYLKRPEKYIQKVYNDGVIEFYAKEKRMDPFGSPIRNGGSHYTSVRKDWYRDMWTSSDEYYRAQALDTKIAKRIAIRWRKDIDSLWEARIGEVHYTLARVSQEAKRNETEISLIRVGDWDESKVIKAGTL